MSWQRHFQRENPFALVHRVWANGQVEKSPYANAATPSRRTVIPRLVFLTDRILKLIPCLINPPLIHINGVVSLLPEKLEMAIVPMVLWILATFRGMHRVYWVGFCFFEGREVRYDNATVGAPV